MKKLFSILLAAALVLSLSVFPAAAADNEPVFQCQVTRTLVDGTEVTDLSTLTAGTEVTVTTTLTRMDTQESYNCWALQINIITLGMDYVRTAESFAGDASTRKNTLDDKLVAVFARSTIEKDVGFEVPNPVSASAVYRVTQPEIAHAASPAPIVFLAGANEQADVRMSATVRFDPNGGALDGEPMIERAIGENITIPDTVREGFTLKYWTDGADKYKSGTSYRVALDKVMTAAWECDVSFDPNGGSWAAESDNPSGTFDENQTLTLPAQLERAGYTLTGWNDEVSDYEPGGTYTAAGNAVLTAVWTPITYRITYILGADEVDNSANPATYTVEDAVTLSAPARAGYSFAGWTPEGAIPQGSTGDRVFTAQWTSLPAEQAQETPPASEPSAAPVSAVLDTAGGTLAEGTSEILTGTVQLPAPTRKGYTFAGWNDGTEVYTAGADYTVPGDGATLTAQWTPLLLRLDLNDGVLPSGVASQYQVGSSFTLPQPEREGYTFTGWSAPGVSGLYAAGRTLTVTDGGVLEAQWQANPAVPDNAGTDNSGSAGTDNSAGAGLPSGNTSGASGTSAGTSGSGAAPSGSGGVGDDNRTETETAAPVVTNPELTIVEEEVPLAELPYRIDGLNTIDHLAYIEGYPDGTVHPNQTITRAETTAMLYRLLTEERRFEITAESQSFHDVPETIWYNKFVASMANGGYIKGYTDGTFGGDREITRAEFVAILSRFVTMTGTVSCDFPDVPDSYWAYDAIALASTLGWVKGYEDGTFHPEQSITRAEAITILNRVLGRGANENSNVREVQRFNDNADAQAWYYYEIIEASNSHTYLGNRPAELWTQQN